MATLEDKLLGEKLEYYCSSSEDEQDGDRGPSATSGDADLLNSVAAQGGGRNQASSNTGPKGVIEDWQRFKQLQAEQREENERKMVELAKKLSMTTATAQDDEKRKEREEIDTELEELMSDEFLQKFQKIRMAEILQQSNNKRFGKLLQLSMPDEFLNCLESESPHTTIVVHVFDNTINACRTMNKCLERVAIDYETVKFAKIPWAATRMSRDFQKNGLPALLVYKGQNLQNSLLRVTDDLSDDFFPSDLESYLIEKGVVIDKKLLP